MEFNGKKIPNYIMIATIILVVVWFNILYFKNRISSNHQSISEYDLSDEDVAPVADLAMTAVFYPANIYQIDDKDLGYIKHKTSAAKDGPRIVIEPHYGYRRSEIAAYNSYKYLLPFADKIKNIFLLGPSHKNFGGVAVPKAGFIKTPVGNIEINQKIIGELSKKDIFKDNYNFYVARNSLNIQLPFILNTFKSVKIIPMLYGNVEAEILADTLKPYIKKGDLLIVTADLAEYNKDLSSEKITKNKADIRPKMHVGCSRIGIDTVIILAKEYGLVPQILDVKKTDDYAPFYFEKKGWSYDEPEDNPILRGVELYNHNLRNFIRHHRKELMEVIRNSLSSPKHTRYQVKRKYYDNFLFNRGASFVNLYYKDKLVGSAGGIIAKQAVAADIADNIFQIKNTLAEQKINEKQLKAEVYLLTDLEEIKFYSQDELLDKIEYGVDGLVIRSGKREGFLMPDVWLSVENKEDFLTKLKIKASLSPAYWSDEVRVFRFRALEVKDNDAN